MATPDFIAKPVGTELTAELASFFSGAALHELAHTRQLPYLTPVFERLQSRYKFPESIDDTLIQTTFAANEEFRKMSDEAGKHITAAVLATDDGIARDNARKALRVMRARQQRFFSGQYEGWAEMEEAFLTLEGTGMFVQFQHARRAASSQAWQQTLGVLMQRTDSWSQTEGLALFLLIDRFDRKWPARFISNAAPPSALGVLEELVQSSQPR